MNIIVSALHLFAGLGWVAALLATAYGATNANRWSRLWGPVVLLTGLLLAIGRVTHQPEKSLLGLYGLAVLISFAFFSLVIFLAKRNQNQKSQMTVVGLYVGLGGMAVTMMLMAHWPLN